MKPDEDYRLVLVNSLCYTVVSASYKPCIGDLDFFIWRTTDN